MFCCGCGWSIGGRRVIPSSQRAAVGARSRRVGRGGRLFSLTIRIVQCDSAPCGSIPSVNQVGVGSGRISWIVGQRRPPPRAHSASTVAGRSRPRHGRCAGRDDRFSGHFARQPGPRVAQRSPVPGRARADRARSHGQDGDAVRRQLTVPAFGQDVEVYLRGGVVGRERRPGGMGAEFRTADPLRPKRFRCQLRRWVVRSRSAIPGLRRA